MQIIESMDDEKYDEMCAAGAELVKRLISMLKEMGLGLDSAPGILAVASGGINKGFNLDSSEYAQLVEGAKMMWRLAPRAGGHELVFDPPHLRPDYQPQTPVVAVNAN
jgi:hypothetical protein